MYAIHEARDPDGVVMIDAAVIIEAGGAGRVDLMVVVDVDAEDQLERLAAKGMSEEEASLALSAVNNAPGPKPWSCTFSYGRALQQAALKAWVGEAANYDAGRAAYAHRARMNSLACAGSYTADLEAATA